MPLFTAAVLVFAGQFQPAAGPNALVGNVFLNGNARTPDAAVLALLPLTPGPSCGCWWRSPACSTRSARGGRGSLLSKATARTGTCA